MSGTGGVVELEGRVSDVGLPDIFRLLRMSRSTGALRITAGRHAGEVNFSDGHVYYATTTDAAGSLGGRLVKAALLKESDLRSVMHEVRDTKSRRSLGAVLVEKGLVSSELLEAFVREQIEDCTFSFFSWPNARFHFAPGEEPEALDVVITLDAEGVVMEGCRRVDEWGLMMQALGSPEKVPCLTAPLTMDTVRLTRQEWDVVCYVDGHRDINTIVAESVLDRFRTVKTIYDLVKAGLIVTRDPTLELLGQKLAIAIRGPIDVYNLTFLSVAATSDVTSHLRIELLEDEEVEVRISAGVREADDEDGLLIYAVEARTPSSIIRRMALETSGFVVLVNINSRDSVVISRADIALMETIHDRPYVVATYASLADEKVSEQQVRDLLELRDRIPVLPCSLRNIEQTAAVMRAVRELIP
jgi:hypothetical protein